MIDNINEQNLAVAGWFTETLRAVKARYMQLIRSPGRSGDGLDSLQTRTRQSYGEIDSGAFKFERYLIFAHKGAGKGMGGSKGSHWVDAHGVTKTTNPLSLGKMNTGSRHAEEWLNPVLDDQVPKLADIVAGFKADRAIKAIQIQ
jgi:hypothetical protein